jgi:thioredoxin-related protein
MNKLLFKLDIPFGKKITLIANNHKDLENYLKENFDFYSVEVSEDSVIIKEREGYENDVATLEWAKHI